MNILPISEVRSRLPSLVDEAVTLSKKTFITVKGKVKAAIVDARELELMEATLEILSDPKTMKAIKKGKKELKERKLIDWEDLKEELGI